MTEYYRRDLAYIHDVGYSEFARESAPGILENMRQNGVVDGMVVDLGCGSGLWARKLVGTGYRVLGIDISGAMIELARDRAPEAEFRVESLFETDIPPCEAVTAIGEVVNYLFDPGNNRQELVHLFRRVYDALAPGGVFVFDAAEPGQVAPGTVAKSFTEGTDWVVLVEKEEDADQKILTRRISTFRRTGEYYRRSDEVHRQRLYEPSEIAGELRGVGFEVQTSRSYGRYRLPEAHTAFVARKPA